MENNLYTYKNYELLNTMDPRSIAGVASQSYTNPISWPLFQNCLEWYLGRYDNLPSAERDELGLMLDYSHFCTHYAANIEKLTGSALNNDSSSYGEFLANFYYQSNLVENMEAQRKRENERRRKNEEEIIKGVKLSAKEETRNNLSEQLTAEDKQGKKPGNTLSGKDLLAHWTKLFEKSGASGEQQIILAEVLKDRRRAVAVAHIDKKRPSTTGSDILALAGTEDEKLADWQLTWKSLIGTTQEAYRAVASALGDGVVRDVIRHMSTSGCLMRLPETSAGAPAAPPRFESSEASPMRPKVRATLHSSERFDLSSYPFQTSFPSFWKAKQEGQGDFLASFLDYWLRGAPGMFGEAGFKGDELGVAAYQAAHEKLTGISSQGSAGERIVGILHKENIPLDKLPEGPTVQESLEGTYDTWRAVLVEENQRRIKGKGYGLGSHAAEVIAKGRNRQYTIYQKAMWAAIDSGLPRVVAGLKRNWPKFTDIPLKPFTPVKDCPDETAAGLFNEFAVKHQREYLDGMEKHAEDARNIVLTSRPNKKAELDRVAEETLRDNIDTPGRTKYAVKSVPSLLSKMLGDASEAKFANLEAPFGKLAGNARDSMRCTVTVETPVMLATTVNALTDHLIANGWKCVQFKNCIVQPLSGGYRGINSQWSKEFTGEEIDALFNPSELTALGGREAALNRKIYFELQFHTPDSFFSKDDATHAAYGKHRDLTRELGNLKRELAELQREPGASETTRIANLEKQVEQSTAAIKALNISLMELTLPRAVGEKIRSIPADVIDPSFFTGINQ
ncbi:hypothetical protein ACFYM0_35975 [Streptomyces sp. NPDC006487]|uniref:hypothetical protein n=1 Tax=Streptomyces sp. NPDC006487 TaxID=3364748 RepID=UPI0036953936